MKINRKLNRILFLIYGLIFWSIWAGYSTASEAGHPAILKEMAESLKSELLDVWYPRAWDTENGGFLADFTYDWQPKGQQHKMIVTQARHVWTASEAAMLLNDEKYCKIAEHGFQFIKEKMWDDKFGGFHMLRNQKGGSVRFSRMAVKQAYGNAFAIYALAAYYRMSGDTSALNLAKKTFLWIDKHSRDPEYKGYFDQMKRDGSWRCQKSSSADNPLERSRCRKDQNSSIHLLEAFTELYKGWPDQLLRERLLEMLTLIRDTITHEKGYLILFLERDWTPVSFRNSSTEEQRRNFYFDHISFGHDVETAFLMLEASHILGLDSDTLTLAIAKKMVDHALANGWDEKNGGFYDAGYYYADSDSVTILDRKKVWWVQAEGLNALLLMSQLFPGEKKYENAFKKQWEYIKKFLIDHEHGGWYEEGLDKSPEFKRRPKGTIWKINYHNGRALMNCIRMLKSERE